MTEGEIQPGGGPQIILKRYKHHKIASGMSKATIQHLTVGMSHKRHNVTAYVNHRHKMQALVMLKFKLTAGCVQIK